jgi:hypothetical protein
MAHVIAHESRVSIEVYWRVSPWFKKGAIIGCLAIQSTILYRRYRAPSLCTKSQERVRVCAPEEQYVYSGQ